MRLIDADEFIKIIREHDYPLATRNGSIDNGMFTNGILQAVDETPTINPESLRPKGEWLDKMVRDWHCSECGQSVPKQVRFDGYCYDDKLNFCPNCGADMRGE